MTIFAYIDPGLGALIWQAVVAAFVGFLFYLNKTRRWIVGGFGKMFGRKKSDEAAVGTASAETPAAKAAQNVEAR